MIKITTSKKYEALNKIKVAPLSIILPKTCSHEKEQLNFVVKCRRRTWFYHVRVGNA
ncbi:MAG: hypothetical protein GY765_12090 [bacterium]|nr:hypothetical protein [bacterium]